MDFKIFDTLRLQREKEDFVVVRKIIEDGAVYHGTNLWVLFFAILIACLGLNINSTAVIIGAMLISPLMGPILGLGVGVAINSPTIIRESFSNYLFSAAVGLGASTIYFLISPIREAHAEILARTQPTVYDVLIALFGGFAGIIAISSKFKGNVIPGAAIATALMPPLCTAGYGLATWQLNYFFGAFYLYIINSVFIAAATFFTAYFLKFPVKKYTDPAVKLKERRLVWTVIIITLLPSIYLGYDLVKQNKFTDRATQFIEKEAFFPNDYLLKKEIDAKNQIITLTFGGQEITKADSLALCEKLQYYGLHEATVQIKQGFSFIRDDSNDEQINQLALALKANEIKRGALDARLDSLNDQQLISRQVFKELKAQCPELKEAVIQPVKINIDSTETAQGLYLVLLNIQQPINKSEREKLSNWLKVRLNKPELEIVFNLITK